MKKYLLLLLLIQISLINHSCKNRGGSIYAMEKRYESFLSILPMDVSKSLTVESEEYGSKYLMWQASLDEWIEKTLEEEKLKEKEIANRLTPSQIEYAIETLTAREYERILPLELMREVKEHTDIISEDIKELEKDHVKSVFKVQLKILKKDEAIVNFTTEDTTFYYVWNYLISLNRERRFQ